MSYDNDQPRRGGFLTKRGRNFYDRARNEVTEDDLPVWLPYVSLFFVVGLGLYLLAKAF